MLLCVLLSPQEYAGIDAERLERMEARLKADVLAEAGRNSVWGPCAATSCCSTATHDTRQQRSSWQATRNTPLRCFAVPCCAAEQYGGRILVARESAAAPGKPGNRSAFSSADDQPTDNPTGKKQQPCLDSAVTAVLCCLIIH